MAKHPASQACRSARLIAHGLFQLRAPLCRQIVAYVGAARDIWVDVGEVSVAKVGGESIAIETGACQSNCLLRNGDLILARCVRKSLNHATVAVARCKIHPRIDPCGIPVKHLLYEANLFEEAVPVLAIQPSQADDAVSHSVAVIRRRWGTGYSGRAILHAGVRRLVRDAPDSLCQGFQQRQPQHNG